MCQIENFHAIKEEILTCEVKKLRTVRNLYSYNQIRFVSACLIQELEL